MTKYPKNISGAMRRLLLGIVPVFFLTGCSDRAYTLEDLASEETAQVMAEATEPRGQQDCGPEPIYVFVCGEVVSPGVIRLEAGSRAGDALELAGGLTVSADETYVNLAEVLQDGQKLYFPSVAEVNAGKDSGGSSGVDINTADAEALCTLPGIGAAKAEAIIDHRTKYGRYERPEDLMQVSGIGEASLERLRPYITVD